MIRSSVTFAALTLLMALARGASSFPTYAEWLKFSGERVDVKTFPAVSSETPRVLTTNVLRSVRWALGERSETSVGALSQSTKQPGSSPIRHVTFGDGVRGKLHFPTNTADQKFPVVIWLNPFVSDEPPISTLTQSGFAVLTFEQIGSGSRRNELSGFYKRDPHWSVLGKMADDSRAAVASLTFSPDVDTNRVWLAGVGTGSLVALHVAALDSRVWGVLALGEFAPMRPALPNRGEPTFAKDQCDLMLLPKFAAFAGHEDRIPYDFRDLVSVIAPRPVVLFAPASDRRVDAIDLARIYEPMKHVSYHVLENVAVPDPKVQRILVEEMTRLTNPSR